MIDNFKQIQELLLWRSDDDFYFIQILQRKKDHKKGKINGTNNNSRLIKAYYVTSLEHLEFIKPEIIALCEVFNARAGINLNRRSFKKMQLKHLKKITLQLIDGTHNKVHKAYNSVVGAYNDDTDKKWILDLDNPIDNDRVVQMESYIRGLHPNVDSNKIIAAIPSKDGYHLITSVFNLNYFKKEYPEVSVHKNNPTNLYIP